jgi:hypothetical protein
MTHHEGTKITKATKTSDLELSHEIIDAAIEVHRLLGPGLVESVSTTDRGLRVLRAFVVSKHITQLAHPVYRC